MRQTNIVNATKQMRQSMIADPVAAVAKGHIMNYLEDMETATEIVDQQLTDIMMAQDFHDLTGQVIAKVVTLASSLESQLVELLVQTAPAGAVLPAAPAQPPAPPVPEAVDAEDVWAAALAEGQPIAHPQLNGPVVDPASTPNVVSSQSEVDDLLASLGF